MNIGIPKERRPFEYRVGMSPAGMEILTQKQNQIYVEHEAGVGAGFSDQEFEKAGARIVYSPEEVFGRADLLLKVATLMEMELVDLVIQLNVKQKAIHINTYQVHYQWHTLEKILVVANSSSCTSHSHI